MLLVHEDLGMECLQDVAALMATGMRIEVLLHINPTYSDTMISQSQQISSVLSFAEMF